MADDFRARMNEVVTAFKKTHRGVRPSRFALSEEDFLTLRNETDDQVPNSALRIQGIPVVRGDKTHIE
jgi:hypothetical protein